MKKNRLLIAGIVLALSFGAVTGCGNTKVDDKKENQNMVNTENNGNTVNDNRVDRATEMTEPDNIADTEMMWWTVSEMPEKMSSTVWKKALTI